MVAESGRVDTLAGAKASPRITEQVRKIRMSRPTDGVNVEVNLRRPLGLGKWVSVFVNVLMSWLLQRSIFCIQAKNKKEHR
ncbi:hypothetical protein Tco_0045216 [Tanacetum coccineum]